MDYRDIDRESVVKAIRECDRLGRESFLKKYSFGKAKKYFLVFNGGQYDSKAIIGVASRYRHGVPLTPQDFAGGNNTVRPVLESLGFKVIVKEINDDKVFPEEVEKNMWEGGRVSVNVNRYERNKEARLKCIEHHGVSCCICGFNFEEVYGEELLGLIHVHHVVPLSKIDEKYRVSPVEDLVPVCPNCHAVIHHGGKTRSINEVKKLVRKPQ